MEVAFGRRCRGGGSSLGLDAARRARGLAVELSHAGETKQPKQPALQGRWTGPTLRARDRRRYVARKENVTAAEATALAHRLEELRKAYDRYFLGIDKLEPQGDRRRFQLELDSILGAPSPNTQVRFQIAQVKGKFVTLQQYWSRVLREIEDGTYQRDRFRVELKERDRGQQPARSEVSPAAAERPIDADVVERVFRAYVMAKQKCNEPTEGITRERLGEMLSKHASKLGSSGAAERPDFKVVIKDGKARIVARSAGEPRTDGVHKSS